jgi:hypothetical protein
MIVVLSAEIIVRIRNGKNPDIAVRYVREYLSEIAKYCARAIEEVDEVLAAWVGVADPWEK